MDDPQSNRTQVAGSSVEDGSILVWFIVSGTSQYKTDESTFQNTWKSFILFSFQNTTVQSGPMQWSRFLLNLKLVIHILDKDVDKKR